MDGTWAAEALNKVSKQTEASSLKAMGGGTKTYDHDRNGQAVPDQSKIIAVLIIDLTCYATMLEELTLNDQKQCHYECYLPQAKTIDRDIYQASNSANLSLSLSHSLSQAAHSSTP